MKNVTFATLFLSLILGGVSGIATADDEVAKRDGTRIPVMLGITAGGEIRMLRTNAAGNLEVVASLTIPWSQTVHGTVLVGELNGAPALFTLTTTGGGNKSGYTIPTTVLSTGSSYEVSIGTSPVSLFPNPLPGASHAMICVNGLRSIYLGGSGITSASGFPISSGSTWSVDPIHGSWTIYAVTATLTSTARVIRW